jgi:hypothetical protein
MRLPFTSKRSGKMLAAGKIRGRGATQPPAHFHRNPPGRASFGRLLCRSSVEDHSGYSPSPFAHPAEIRRRRYTSHGLGALWGQLSRVRSSISRAKTASLHRILEKQNAERFICGYKKLDSSSKTPPDSLFDCARTGDEYIHQSPCALSPVRAGRHV